jgi:colicin import membrane protein
LFQQNNKKRTRKHIKERNIGDAKVMSFEDIVEARILYDLAQAEKERKKAEKEKKKVEKEKREVVKEKERAEKGKKKAEKEREEASKKTAVTGSKVKTLKRARTKRNVYSR